MVEFNVTLENKCHSGVTVFYTNIMLPPKPHYEKGENNKKSKNRKQHFVKCKLILWVFILYMLETCIYFSSDVRKYVYQYYL